ncbi:MAG TPA: methyltransferase domain-containing protein [Casimicrobium sp.]|nr:methyltransferase domain-containing protein [Casimicrobium sp.]
MNSHTHPEDCDTFDDWLETPLGRYVVGREQAIFDRALPDLFGFYALQIGCAGVPLMQSSRVTHQFTMAWDTDAALLAEPDQLPFSDNQFDVIVLPHTLEFQALPHEVLREVFRVLRPEGRLLITGFNPYSAFGIKRYFGRERSTPWNAEFISLSRAKDWLTLLGFDIVGGQLDCYALPAQTERNLQRLTRLESAGDRWWPFAGGVYFLHAVKRVAGVRLLKPDWARTPRRKRAAVVPTRAMRDTDIPSNLKQK